MALKAMLAAGRDGAAVATLSLTPHMCRGCSALCPAGAGMELVECDRGHRPSCTVLATAGASLDLCQWPLLLGLWAAM